MEEGHFELLLAMMRVLKREDQLASSLETAIVNILHSFEPQFDGAQKKALSNEFVHYQALVQKKKQEEDAAKRMESEDYKKIIAGFLQGEVGW